MTPPAGQHPSAQSLEMLAWLVAFPTVSRNSNLGLIEAVRDYLNGFGVAARLTYDAAGGKANLFATLGDASSPGIVLSGHTDVVPVDGQDWATDPFAATRDGDRIYGRGTADMKGFIAVALAMVPALLERPGPSPIQLAPIQLALSYDEEVGCLGVRALLRDIAAAGIRPLGCVIGEPTGMEVMVGHKGALAFECHVHGRECHSSLAPRGVNAIEYAARLIGRVREIAERLTQEEQRHFGFDVPHSTLQTGTISGGIAVNVVPRDCVFQFDIRHLPGTRWAALFDEIEAYARNELEPVMRRVAPESRITFRQLVDIPVLEADAATPFARYIQEIADSRGAGYVAFGTEGGLFQQAGIPTLICGPGSIGQAHKPDEYVTLDQLARCETFMRKLVLPDPTGAALR
jgi:acetylornithine deacetylase